MPLCAQSGIEFSKLKTWNQILKTATKENKYIFMDCYTSWCGPCKALAKETFTDAKVGDYFNKHFLNVSYDMEKGEGKKIRELYKDYIRNFPTLLIFDSKGNVLHQLVGYMKPDELINGANKVFEGKGLIALRKQYETNQNDLSFLKTYVQALNDAFQKDEAQAVVDKYIKSKPLSNIKEPEIWNFVKNNITDVYSPQFEYMVIQCGTPFLYQMKEDVYSVTNNWNTLMLYALMNLVDMQQDDRGNYIDTVKVEREHMEKLKSLAEHFSFRCSPEIMAELKVHQLKIENKWADVCDIILALQDTNTFGLYGYDSFTRYSIWQISKHLKDPVRLKKCLDLMNLRQNQEKGSFFLPNYYDIISSLYTSLGNKEEADNALKKYEETKKANKIKSDALDNHK